MTKIKKIFICLLSLLMLFSAASVLATEDTFVIDNSAGVFASKHSSYKVMIPKLIVLNRNIETTKYIVSVSGDLSGTECIVVMPKKSLILNCHSVENIKANASVQQDKTQWTYRDFDKDATGIVSATNLMNGVWSGQLYFEIGKLNNPISVP